MSSSIAPPGGLSRSQSYPTRSQLSRSARGLPEADAMLSLDDDPAPKAKAAMAANRRAAD